MLRNVPHLALIPLVILWFGIDESAKIFLVALGTMFPIYINTWHGIRNIDRGLVEMARSYGLSGFALFRHVILPGPCPRLWSASVCPRADVANADCRRNHLR
jgi:sulfonate transport system permease protein